MDIPFGLCWTLIALSMIKSCYVTNVDYLNTTSVQCVHGDVKRYPRAEVLVDVQMYLLNVAIVDSLPTDMILGQDLPVLNDLLQATGKDSVNVATATETPVNLSCPAITRSQARAGLQLLPDLDDSLLQDGTKGLRKSRRQRRLEKYLGTPIAEVSVEGLGVNGWQVPGNIAELQRNYVTLKPLFEKTVSANPSNLCNERYVLMNVALYVLANDFTVLLCQLVVVHLSYI